MSFYFLHRNYFKENTYEKKYEIVNGFGSCCDFFWDFVWSCCTQYPGGGVWTYGASNGGAFSNYYHGSKYHSSTVVSRWTSKSSKAYAYAGQTSYAFIKTSFGEQAAFYYNYN